MFFADGHHLVCPNTNGVEGNKKIPGVCLFRVSTFREIQSVFAFPLPRYDCDLSRSDSQYHRMWQERRQNNKPFPNVTHQDHDMHRTMLHTNRYSLQIAPIQAYQRRNSRCEGVFNDKTGTCFERAPCIPNVRPTFCLLERAPRPPNFLGSIRLGSATSKDRS